MPSNKIRILTLIATLLIIFTSTPIHAARTGEFEVARIADVVYPDKVKPGELIQVLVTAEYEDKLLIDVGLMDRDRDVILDSYTMISTFTGPGFSNFTFHARAPLEEGPWRLRVMTRAWWANSWYSDPGQGSMDFEVFVKDSVEGFSRMANFTITSNVSSLNVTLNGSPWSLRGGRLTVEFETGFHELSVDPIVNVNPSERWVFVKWSDNVSSPSRGVYLTGDLTIDAVYRPQYRVRVEPNGGIVSGDGWYWAGSKAYVSALPTVEKEDCVKEFVEWTGDLESGENPAELTVDSPKLVKAMWRPLKLEEVRNLSQLFILCSLSICSLPLTYLFTRRRKFRTDGAKALLLTVMLIPYMRLEPIQAHSSSVNIQLGNVAWRYWKNPTADVCVVWLGGGILEAELRINPFWLESYNTRRFIEGLSAYYSILAVEEGPNLIPQPKLNRTIHAVIYRPGMLKDVRLWLKQEGYRFIYMMGYSVGGIAVLQEALEGDPEGWEAPNGVILITVPVKGEFKAEANRLRSNLLLIYGEKMTKFYVDSGFNFFQGVPTRPLALKEFHLASNVAHEVWTIAESGEYAWDSTSLIIGFVERAKLLYFNSLPIVGNLENGVRIDNVRAMDERGDRSHVHVTGQTWSVKDEPYIIAAKDHEGRILSIWGRESLGQLRNFSLHIPRTSMDEGVVELHAYWVREGTLLNAEGNPIATLDVRQRPVLTVRAPLAPSGFEMYFDGIPYRAENGSVEFRASLGVHNLTVPSMVQLGSSRLKFLVWSDGENQSTRLVELTEDAELKAIYMTQHSLSAESSYGRVDGSGWYEEGSLATLRIALPLALKQYRGRGLFFAGWSLGEGEFEACNGTQITVVVTGPMSVKVNWYAVDGEHETLHLYLISDGLAGFTLFLSVYLALRERGRARKMKQP